MTKEYSLVDLVSEIILIISFSLIGYYISIILYSRNTLIGIMFLVFYVSLILLSINFKILKYKYIRRK
jgi:hypothetical protein